jgi:hypothetical protein
VSVGLPVCCCVLDQTSQLAFVAAGLERFSQSIYSAFIFIIFLNMYDIFPFCRSFLSLLSSSFYSLIYCYCYSSVYIVGLFLTKAVDKTLCLSLLYAYYCVSYVVSLMFQSTQQLCNKPINTIVSAFVYCVEVLLHVSTLSVHHQAIITWIYYSLLDWLPIWIQMSDF